MSLAILCKSCNLMSTFCEIYKSHNSNRHIIQCYVGHNISWSLHQNDHYNILSTESKFLQTHLGSVYLTNFQQSEIYFILILPWRAVSILRFEKVFYLQKHIENHHFLQRKSLYNVIFVLKFQKYTVFDIFKMTQFSLKPRSTWVRQICVRG